MRVTAIITVLPFLFTTPGAHKIPGCPRSNRVAQTPVPAFPASQVARVDLP
jgi:hypothetical protein